MIVVDSNVLAYLYLPGSFTEAAEKLLEQDPEWHAPILWRSEYRNILAGYMRRGTLPFEQACAIQTKAEAFSKAQSTSPLPGMCLNWRKSATARLTIANSWRPPQCSAPSHTQWLPNY